MNKKYIFLCLILGFQIITPETAEQRERNRVAQLIARCAPRNGSFSEKRTKEALPKIKHALEIGRINTGIITRILGKRQSLFDIAKGNPLILPLLAKHYPAYQVHLEQIRHIQELQNIFERSGMSYEIFTVR